MAGEANVWNPQTILNLSADTKKVEEQITATSGQTAFTLTTFTYALSTGSLAVYKKPYGSSSPAGLLKEGIDWAETSESTFSLVIPCAAGDVIIAVGYVGITADVDVRDTDIYVNNYQAVRDYAGSETVLVSKGRTVAGDVRERTLVKVTGAAPGTYVDDAYSAIVPTGGDGSAAWLTEAYRDIDVKQFATVAAFKAAANIKVGDVIILRDRALSKWLIGSGVAGANDIDIIGNTAGTMHAALIYGPGVYIDALGFDTTGATNDATKLQHLFDRVRDYGGNFYGTRNATYRSDSALTLLSNSTNRKHYLLDWGGSVLSFENSVLTTGDLLAWGATSQANAHDNEIDQMSNLLIIGNEPPLTTTPTTDCVGLSLEYALRLRMQNIYVQSCYEGIKTNFVFDLQADNCCVLNNYIGLRIDDTSTYALWNNFQMVNNRYGRVIKPSTSGAVIANQTFVNPRFEGNDVGSAIDGGTNASFGVRAITDINVYAEGNTYDLYREGLQWTLANPQTRNAASVGYVVNTRILGGDWSGMTWSGTCAAIVWPSTIGTVVGGDYRVPVAISNCVNYPGKATFQQLVDLTAGLGQNINPTSMPGYGVCVIRGSDGATTISNNLISSTARTGTGVYTITLREAMTGNTDFAVGATCDGGYVEVDTATSTTTLITLKAFSNANVAIDPSRVRVMIHGVLT